MTEITSPDQPGIKVALIGTVVNDKILPFGGGEIRSLGGITYTVMQMALLAPEHWQIFPVCRVGTDVANRFLSLLRDFPNVHTDAVRVVQRTNTQVTLVYESPSERTEYTTGPMPPLGFEELAPVLDASITLVNFITGFDVEFEALKRYSEETHALLYIDFHSLALGVAENGMRYYRRPRNWQDVVRLPHILQMNEREAACLAGREQLDRQELVKFGLEILGKTGNRPFAVNVTLDGQGSLLFWQDEIPRWQPIPAHRVHVVDPTGCGDSFAAGFIRKYWETGDPVQAAQFANLVAGLKCTVRGADNLSELRPLMRAAVRGDLR